MQQIAVESKAISHLEYNPATETCTVRFHNGRRTAFTPMSEEDFKAFLGGEGFDPPSVGKHFSERVRNNGRYKSTNLPPVQHVTSDEPLPAGSSQQRNYLMVTEEELRRMSPEVQATATAVDSTMFRVKLIDEDEEATAVA